MNSVINTSTKVPVINVPCGLCNHNDYTIITSGQDYEYETCNNIFYIVECKKCKNLYLNPRPKQESLSIIYPPHYYAYDYEKNVNSIARWAKSKLDLLRFNTILNHANTPINSYMDIGCGDGRYLETMHNKGLKRENICGIELDKSVCNKLKHKGYQAYCEPFENITSFKENSFDLITLFSVLEHLSSPKDVLKKAKEILSPGGLIVFEVPNTDSLNAKIFKKQYWGGYHFPRHWQFFSRSRIKRLADELGFEIVKIQMTTGHAFWLWSLHHFVIYKLGWKKIGRLLNPNKCLIGLIIVMIIDSIRTLLNSNTDNMLVYISNKDQ